MTQSYTEKISKNQSKKNTGINKGIEQSCRAQEQHANISCVSIHQQ